jgi:ribonuclease HI
MIEELLVYSDGGARGNPGHAGIGVLIAKPDGTQLYEFKSYLGIRTNNQAEYSALIRGLELAKDYGVKRVKSFVDSELLAKQLRGEYRVRNPVLKEMYGRAKALEKSFEEVIYEHVPREDDKIKIADRLVNEAIDSKERYLEKRSR